MGSNPGYLLKSFLLYIPKNGAAFVPLRIDSKWCDSAFCKMTKHQTTFSHTESLTVSLVILWSISVVWSVYCPHLAIFDASLAWLYGSCPYLFSGYYRYGNFSRVGHSSMPHFQTRTRFDPFCRLEKIFRSTTPTTCLCLICVFFSRYCLVWAQ